MTSWVSKLIENFFIALNKALKNRDNFKSSSARNEMITIFLSLSKD